MQGPEIRTGFLQNPDKPVKLTSGKEITLTTDYEAKGTEDLIACRYKARSSCHSNSHSCTASFASLLSQCRTLPGYASLDCPSPTLHAVLCKQFCTGIS